MHSGTGEVLIYYKISIRCVEDHFFCSTTTKTIKIQYLDDSITRLTYVGGKSDLMTLSKSATKRHPSLNSTDIL